MRRALLGITLAAAVAAPAAAQELAVPFLSGRVVDEAGILTPAEEETISSRLAALEQETGSQVAVLTVPTLGDLPIEDYALKVAETWKLGRAGVDDGVVFLVVPNDRAMRLEVGYGLEPKLTDLTSKRILDELVAPHFRSGDWVGGILAGVDAIGEIARGGDPLPPPRASSRPDSPQGLAGLFMLAFFLLPIAWRAAIDPDANVVAFGIVLAFVVGVPFALLGGLGLLIGLGIAALLVLMRLWARLTGSGRRMAQRRLQQRRSSGPGGWWVGPGGGGRFGGGGGFSGGGFSGGGRKLRRRRRLRAVVSRFGAGPPVLVGS